MRLCDRTSKGFCLSHRRVESTQRFKNKEEICSHLLENRCSSQRWLHLSTATPPLLPALSKTNDYVEQSPSQGGVVIESELEQFNADSVRYDNLYCGLNS